MRSTLILFLSLGAVTQAGCSADSVGFVYDSCFDSFDCEALADACFSVANPESGITDNFCSVLCSSDLDCPLDGRGVTGACLRVEGGGGLDICYERCVDDFDCPAGFGCFDTIDASDPSLTDPICLPL